MLCLKVDGRKVDVLLLGLRNDYHLHQKLLIAKNLQIKSLAIFFLQCLQLQALTAFLRRARDCYSQRSTIPATAFCTTFSAKVSETQGRKSLEHYCLLSTIYKNWYSKDLVYQIDGAKVGFSPLLLRLLICQVLVLICPFAYFADASYHIWVSALLSREFPT